MPAIDSSAPIPSTARTSLGIDQQRGSFKGIQVQAGIVGDANADINFDLRSGMANVLVAQRAGERTRKGVLTDRASQIRKGAEKRAAAALGDFVELYGNAFRSFLSQLKTAQKRKKGRLEESEIREQAEQLFEDPSIRHAAVEAAAQMESEMGEDDGLTDLLHQFAQTLMEEEGPAIRAGYNINSTIAYFAETSFESYRALRDAYRETLLSDATEEQIYEFLVRILPRRLRRVLRKGRQNHKNGQSWTNEENLSEEEENVSEEEDD